MSDTVSKRDGEDESQDNIAGAANDDDDDLDAALFGEDDEGADDEPTDADAVPMEESGQLAMGDISSSVPLDQTDAVSNDADEVIDEAKQKADERSRIIMGLMTEEQLDRYEAFRRSAVSQRNIKRVLQTVNGQNVQDKIVIVMRGIAKVYVGELVEAAQLIANEQGDSVPLQPAHYRAAYQHLNSQGKVPHKAPSKRLKL